MHQLYLFYFDFVSYNDLFIIFVGFDSRQGCSIKIILQINVIQNKIIHYESFLFIMKFFRITLFLVIAAKKNEIYLIFRSHFHAEPSPIVATTDHRRPLLLRSPPMILTSSTWTGWRGRTRTGRRTWTFSHSHLCWMSCKKIKI